ncbi:D-alanyl-D-alanine carboxypeptidase family protein [Pseudobacteroides cellulosolvens]|uniref:serine-type D-Ala-D-Ala carboxypeptidase n=1 Tax=Pseudobacteroides cellulosolvens ATCC 35603 = DSM 2933 TaxID=398512 RepID=A0A0L6JH43_9FIRM|nr:D-alanyl-D-alanine carboxypeptidase family protein [Pseudobacteroides cellulosolvens]KNY25043.1 Serine-type D-Ala-D-Ala carboxypeptidase [Pseudobacteroides cellulosolvens ATCC 35603 = DSM 2933]
MIKRLSVIFILIVSLFANTAIMPVVAAPQKNTSQTSENTAAKKEEANKTLELKAKAAILIDAETGTVMFEKNSHEELPLASVTKVMSMLLIMEAIDSGKVTYEDMVPVSEHAYNMGGSQVYLKPGEEFTVLEMLKAVAIHSANDAVVALAEKISGSEEIFVSAMNEKAKQLGMNNTNFLDCNGLTDDGHYSSASDIGKMSAELIRKHPKVLEITKIWQDKFRNGQFSLDNTNRLIHTYNGATGLKTGFTTKAGYCLSASADRNDMQLIAVVLGEPDSNTRFAEAKKLLDYGYANYQMVKIKNKGEELGTVEVKKGVGTSVKGALKADVSLMIKKGKKDTIKQNVKMTESIEAPVKSGQKIGEITFEDNGQIIAKEDVVAVEEVKKASFVRLFFRMVVGWFGIGRK